MPENVERAEVLRDWPDDPPRQTMTRSGADWIYTDIHGDEWRLVPEGRRDSPFTMMLERRR